MGLASSVDPAKPKPEFLSTRLQLKLGEVKPQTANLPNDIYKNW
jgi:hypothetical protein